MPKHQYDTRTATAQGQWRKSFGEISGRDECCGSDVGPEPEKRRARRAAMRPYGSGS